MEGEFWFKPKEFGFGATPTSWQDGFWSPCISQSSW